MIDKYWDLGGFSGLGLDLFGFRCGFWCDVVYFWDFLVL